jgi:glycosyltransferase involved in cell wall biosynthesis
MTQRCVALFGRGDQPTDALQEYCSFLREALKNHGYDMEMARVDWPTRGWPAALAELRRAAVAWRGVPVFVQYTALAWSERGFPARVLRAMKILRSAGACVGVVFHDVEPYAGTRIVDRFRRHAQLRVMREMLRRADMAIFTVALDHVSWRPDALGNPVFIPVGANFSDAAISFEPSDNARTSRAGRTIAVYGVTGLKYGRDEIKNIIEAVRDVAKQIPGLRLVILGRNSQETERDFRDGLQATGVELSALGVLPPARVAEELLQADVLLFLRGEISTRRGSAIAGISCGLPVVCFAGLETAPPITEAGLALYSREKLGDLSRVLVGVLSDARVRETLAARSRTAHENYFSWRVIAARYAGVLGSAPQK